MTFRIITTMSDGRSSRVLSDKISQHVNLGDAKIEAGHHIKPYEGGRSHVQGVAVTIYNIDTGQALAWRRIDEEWHLENAPPAVTELGDAQRTLDDRNTF